jgi:hypothetical protein
MNGRVAGAGILEGSINCLAASRRHAKSRTQFFSGNCARASRGREAREEGGGRRVLDDREETITDDFRSRVRAELPDKQKNCVDVRAK